MESNQDSWSLVRSTKRVKRGMTDSKLDNLDIVRVKRTEIFNRQLNSFNFFSICQRAEGAVKKVLEKFYSKVFDGPYGGDGPSILAEHSVRFKVGSYERIVIADIPKSTKNLFNCLYLEYWSIIY